MRTFTIHAARDAAEAVRAHAGAGATGAIGAAASGDPQDATQYLAGGTTLLDLMKLDVMQPRALVDLSAWRGGPAALPSPDAVRVDAQGLWLSASASMATVADNPVVQREYPVIAESLQLSASPQIRNMATLGGNLLQRTRCSYFRETRWSACNKRTPGSGCAALGGVTRQHAVLGTSDRCIATYPGDFAQALVALDATLTVLQPMPGGQPPRERQLSLRELHRLPGDHPERETRLAPGELITAIQVPAGAWTRRSHYLKLRDRTSYQFALASAAVALDLDGQRVRSARIALGGVATVPWRAEAAERALVGRVLDDASAAQAAEAAFAQARAQGDNAYKIPLGREVLARALLHTLTLPA